ncbi:hypothetical protein OEZ85_007638 [Tetradesmus obliquus]|uniref:Peptidase S8/S53 domain-containing protein n=1 Tax=Tetradesmus obliquus TaxID=3088 RepID=A0ABY8TGR3_TETOB|nr:hypothetical protein OEZ85_007638 [Tetradesmus obliquus]
MTDASIRFLGLAGPAQDGGGGMWDRLRPSPATLGTASAGEGMVVGIIDTGYSPGHPSFAADASYSNPTRRRAKTFNTTCQEGQGFPTSTCNLKVIGCKFFYRGMGNESTIATNYPNETLSCSDAAGHGSHTASTAAGNWGVAVPGDKYGPQWTAKLSGAAPRARIVSYKALWGGSGTAADIIAALEAAVQDGVDVINYSVGSSQGESLRDIISEAFMQVARAGILCVASAGNDGDTGTVTNSMPWAVTVAASTHDRTLSARFSVSGSDFVGASVNRKDVGPAPAVLAVAAAKEGANLTEANLCYANTLNPALVTGKIVICDRGIIPRVDKSKNVAAAGGVGMVMLNTPDTPDNTVADTHSVPSVHLKAAYRDPVRQLASQPDASGVITEFFPAYGNTAPQMAAFSSRGPTRAAGGRLLKPDITAPGQDILAAWAPRQDFNPNFAIVSGTSMSSPHMAGIAALLRQRFPRWSPMAIKSAMMTSAYQTTRTGNSGQVFGDPFDFGAGHVDPLKALNPGLVFDSKFEDWQNFLCGVERKPGDTWCSVCDASPSKCNPDNFNAPSISLPDLQPGLKRSFTRVVQNVELGRNATFTASVSFNPGNASAYLSAEVSPATFTVNRGRIQTLTISITVKPGAPFGTYMFGAITWTSNLGSTARIPLAVKTVPFATVPASVTLSTAQQPSVSGSYSVTAAFSGTLELTAYGAVPAVVATGTASDKSSFLGFSVPEGLAYARFALFAQDYSGNPELDLFVFNPTLTAVWQSAQPGSDEAVLVRNPSPGQYILQVYANYSSTAIPELKARLSLNPICM